MLSCPDQIGHNATATRDIDGGADLRGRKHYHANKDAYLARAVAKKQLIREYLRNAKDRPCADCGKRYPYYVMQFDHTSDDKEFTIASMVNFGNLPSVEREVAKCEVVCANCHMERTHQRRVQAEIAA